jgi:hypothetical protein
MVAEKVCTAAHMGTARMCSHRLPAERGRGVSEVEARAGLSEIRRSPLSARGPLRSFTERSVCRSQRLEAGVHCGELPRKLPLSCPYAVGYQSA